MNVGVKDAVAGLRVRAVILVRPIKILFSLLSSMDATADISSSSLSTSVDSPPVHVPENNSPSPLLPKDRSPIFILFIHEPAAI